MRKKISLAGLIKNRIVLNLLIIIFLAIFLCFVVSFFLNKYTRHDKEIVIPKVLGMKVEEANKAFTPLRLKYEIVDSLYVDNVIPGTIIEQIPSANSKIKPGRTVFLKIQAEERKKISIPNMAGMSKREALIKLAAMGFNKINVKEAPSEYVDMVIGISYMGKTLDENQSIPENSEITLIVGDGQAPSGYSLPSDSSLQRIENDFSE